MQKCHFLWPNWKHFWREYIFLGFCQLHCYFSALRSKNEKNWNSFVGIFNFFVLFQLLLWEVNWFRIKTSKQKERERVCERKLKQQLVTQRNDRNMHTLLRKRTTTHTTWHLLRDSCWGGTHITFWKVGVSFQSIVNYSGWAGCHCCLSVILRESVHMWQHAESCSTRLGKLIRCSDVECQIFTPHVTCSHRVLKPRFVHVFLFVSSERHSVYDTPILSNLAIMIHTFICIYNHATFTSLFTSSSSVVFLIHPYDRKILCDKKRCNRIGKMRILLMHFPCPCSPFLCLQSCNNYTAIFKALEFQ